MSTIKPKQPSKSIFSPTNSFTPANEYRVETRSVSEIKIDKNHPKKVSKKQAEKAATCVRASRLMPFVLLDSSGHLVVGEEWLAAAKILGIEEIQVLLAESMTEAQIRQFRMAYYRIQEDGEWNKNNLAAEFRYLINAELTCEIDFTVDATGFEFAEIDIILGEGDEQEEDPSLTAPEIDPNKPVISKSGDLWNLGRHSIICGDSLDPATHQKLLQDIRVQLINSDPPYNIKICGFASGNGAVKHAEFSMASGEMSSGEFDEFLYLAILYTLTRLDQGCCIYLSIDWRHIDQLQAAAKRCGLTLLNICVWDKGVGGMGSLYRSQHEFVLVYRKGKTQHQNNIMLGKYGRNRTNLWQYPSANMSKEGREALKDHPTPKPVAMIADIIKDVTKPNDVIFDPFLGGGTTIIAAEKTDRRGYGIELDPRYVDVTIRRWQVLTGQQAIHAETGLAFAEHEQRVVSSQKCGKTEDCRDRNRKK